MSAEPSTSGVLPETTSEPSTSKELPKTASEYSTSMEEEPTQSPAESQPAPIHEETSHSLIVPDEPPTPAECCAVVPGCINCSELLKQNRQLTNKVKTLREIVGKRREEVKVYRRKCKNNNYFVLDPFTPAY